MIFIVKTLIAALVIAGASMLAKQKPVLAGFIVAMPLTSMLSLLLLYAETKSSDQTVAFALSILSAVPLSLVFFLPFVLNHWLKWPFAGLFVSGTACLTAGYFLHRYLAEKIFHIG